MMKRVIALMLAAVMVLSLAACGGGNDGNTKDTTGNTDTTAPADNGGGDDTTDDNSNGEDASGSGGYVQGVTDTEILIANSAAVSGAYAPVGVPFIAGIRAYLEMVNADGGIDGRQITFIHQDDEFDPVKGKAALQNFVEDEKVFAIVGHFGTPVVGATIEDLKDYGIPAVYFATGIGQLYAENAQTNADGYNIFPVQPIYITEGQIMVARGVGNFDAEKIGVIYTNDDAGKDMLQGATAMAEQLGIELVSEQVAAGSADVSAAVTSIKNADVDFIICAAIQATMPTIVKELAAQSVNKDVITTYVNVDTTIAEQVGNEIDGKFEVYGNGWVAYDKAENLELYQQWADEEYHTNAYAQTGWIAAHFFCEALRKLEGKEVTWESYMAALEDGDIENPFGGVINYSGGTRAGTQEMNLSKINLNSETGTGWEVLFGLENTSVILGK